MPESGILAKVNSKEIESNDYYENLLSYIRGRLNVINTSIYLVESNLTNSDYEVAKYLKKINQEMESLRRLINI